jgi:hypothetical protein
MGYQLVAAGAKGEFKFAGKLGGFKTISPAFPLGCFSFFLACL